MAASLTLLSATPNALRYLWGTDAAGSQTATRTKAQMLADCAAAGQIPPGPSSLLAFLTPLTGAAGVAGWADMDQTASGSKGARLDVSVYVTTTTNGICFKAAFGAGDTFDVTAQAGGGAIAAGDEAIVTLQLRNTLA